MATSVLPLFSQQPAQPSTSARGVLSLLDEPEVDLKVYALQQLTDSVDYHWHEVAASISKIETLYDDEDFKDRQLAALVAAKVFYHMEDFDVALKYALGAGPLFDLNQSSLFVNTMLSKCVDEYIRLRKIQYKQEGGESKSAEAVIDDRLVAVVERMFERCFATGRHKEALGVALEARRLDVVEKSVVASGQVKEMLGHLFKISQSQIDNRTFRHQVLRVLVKLYRNLEVPDYIAVCQCLLFLDDAQSVADILGGLIKKDEDSALIAYQVAFDLADNQNQPFLLRVSAGLPADDNASEDSSTNKLKAILSGKTPVLQQLNFLYSNQHTDLNILNFIKDKLEPRNSITHNATIIAHSFMNSGTTRDSFLRDNLEWLGKATNWAKFTVTASIGVIHKGHHQQSLKLLQPYLPQNGQSGSAYQEGGALFALGLIHANYGADQIAYLLDALRNAGNNEIVQHGACLGLGLAAMSTNNMEIFEVLKNIIYTESAVAGEAAGLAMGLVLLGSNNGDVIQEMLAYAHDTKHEKIIRGVSMGLALMAYGCEEQADVLIEQMEDDKDPLIRYGGMYAIALAYAATSNNSAIRRLLHVAVSDVNDDVRRAAVTALGFVLADQPEQVPRIVALLAESYNFHVRYGACLAVGMACAGTGSKEALDLLEPLLKDRVDLVRQGAYVAMSLVLMQHNEVQEPKVKTFRKAINDAMSLRGDTMTKFGAIFGAGLLDAGGRNVNISLVSPAGHKKMAAIVGCAIFNQFWYWYPLVHFVSLAFTPTAVIGLNKDMKLPKDFNFQSNARPSEYAYPAPMEVKKAEEKKELKKATLSASAKAKARQTKKAELVRQSSMTAENKDKEGDVEMGAKTDEPKAESKEAETKTEAKEGEAKEGETKEGENKDEAKKEEERKAKEPEPEFEILHNPARVTWSQQKQITFDPKQRYVPVKEKLAGIVMLRDTRPDEKEELVASKTIKIGVPGISDDEPEPPQPFQFTR